MNTAAPKQVMENKIIVNGVTLKVRVQARTFRGVIISILASLKKSAKQRRRVKIQAYRNTVVVCGANANPTSPSGL